ncbi:MAG TPA: DUF3090 family protein, partial [Thermomicrobiales bacterium]|nr:DUF3090 family protein [Thermomicrobiales bacterium]
MADDFLSSRPGGDADRVRVDALGEPGQRRFRMLASVAGETHIIWMEKQQMQALGLAIEQMLEQLPDRAETFEVPTLPIEFDDDTRSQFRVGRMELGFDLATDRIIIGTHDVQQEESEQQPSLSVRITRRQVIELSTDAASVVAAGRPRCPMCGD